jgi:asparagine synthase (glutamine-hydrolysing)
MCGIVAGRDSESSSKNISKALNSIQRRGPDESWVEQISPEVFFGFNLLGINSRKTQLLKQPFASKTVTACINGEVYNYSDLRKELEKKDYKFATESDCEVFLHGLDCFGPQFLSKVNGEFALVAYFHTTKSWLCAVDHVGTKPLKYFLSGEKFLIASSALALRELGVKMVIDKKVCLFAFYNACVPLGQTLFENVRTIPPGHYVEISEQFEAKVLKYLPGPKLLPAGDQPLSGQIENAVLSRVPRDFKPALALSGGIDSSLIALILKNHGAEFSAFSIDFPESEYSEFQEVQKFCRKHDLKNNLISISQDELQKEFPESVLNAENLVINPHSAAKLILNRSISENGHRVCFTGDGADELFWGYDHFHATDEFQFLRDSNFIGSQYAQILKPEHRAELLQANLFADFHSFNEDPSAQDLYCNYWLNEYGLKILGDAQAASQSLEYRYPFLDLGLRVSLKSVSRAANFPSKAVLRQVVHQYDTEKSQTAKRPFIAPIITKKWLPLFEEFVFNDKFEELGLFESSKLRSYVNRLSGDLQYGNHSGSSILLSQILSLGILNQGICRAG